jgi:hypothetical protein
VWRILSRALDSSTYATCPISHHHFYWGQTITNKITVATKSIDSTNTTPNLDTLVQQPNPVPSSAQDLNSMNNTIITAALKEWAIVCKALEDGRQVLLFRKGGIREYRQGFALEHKIFLLYPTFEHQSKESIQADYAEKFEMVMSEQPSDKINVINSFAHAVVVKQITDGSPLPGLQKYHIWNDGYVDVRMNYNPNKPMNIVLLRVYKLDNPIELEVKSEWHGCKSWIPIESFSFQSQPTNQIVVQHQLFPEYQSNHGKYRNSRYNVRPVLDDSKFEKILAEIGEILK